MGKVSKHDPVFVQCFEVSTRDKLVSEVTATFEPETATGILGPSSSCGSALLLTLLGRTPRTRGEIRVNGWPRDALVRRLAAYLPKNAAYGLHGALTVKQSIYWAAMLRSPSSQSKMARFARADVVMERFGLVAVQNQRVGYFGEKHASTSKLSPGQKKRVLVAIELLSLRPLLFADQPTTDLSAAGAASVVDALVLAASAEGRTSVATISQPSSAIAGAFHRLLILGHCGRVVFDGPPTRLAGYMEERGAACTKPWVHAADKMIDILARDTARWRDLWIHSEDHATLRNTNDRLLTLLLDNYDDPSTKKKRRSWWSGIKSCCCCYLWTKRRVDTATLKKDPAMIIRSAAADEEDDDDDDDDDAEGKRPRLLTLSTMREYPLTWWQQYRALSLRALHLWLADHAQGPLAYELLFATAVLVAVYAAAATDDASRIDLARFASAIAYEVALMPAVVSTPPELEVVAREHLSGSYAIPPYWLAKLALILAHSALVAILVAAVLGCIGVWANDVALAVMGIWASAAFLEFATAMLFGTAIGALVGASAGAQLVVAALIAQLALPGEDADLSQRGVVMPDQFPKVVLKALFRVTPVMMETSSTAGSIFQPWPWMKHLLLGGGGEDSHATMAYFVVQGILFFVAALASLGATVLTVARCPRAPTKKRRRCCGLRACFRTILSCCFRKKKRLSQKHETVPTPPADVDSDDDDDVENPTPGSSSASLWGWDAQDYGATSRTTNPPPVALATHDLTYRRRTATSQRPALQDVTVSFEPGTPCVVLGPSGAGKSSLFDALGGRVASAKDELTGRITANGRTTFDAAFARRTVTYTPQDAFDGMLPEVTVLEALAFRACLQCPVHWSQKRRSLRILEIARTLNLQRDFRSIVGSASRPNISPGLRRRLSFAMDLFAIERPVFLADCPTSGLNSREAWAVVETLAHLSRTHRRTVVVALAQPSWAQVVLFDKLVVLARGRLAFSGRPDDLADFFERCGAAWVPPARTTTISPQQQLGGPYYQGLSSTTTKNFHGKQDVHSVAEHAAEYAMHILNEDDHAADLWANKWALFLNVDAAAKKRERGDGVATRRLEAFCANGGRLQASGGLFFASGADALTTMPYVHHQDEEEEYATCVCCTTMAEHLAAFYTQYLLLVGHLVKSTSRSGDPYVMALVSFIVGSLLAVATTPGKQLQWGFACALAALTPTFMIVANATTRAGTHRDFFRREISNGACTLIAAVAAYWTRLTALAILTSVATTLGYWRLAVVDDFFAADHSSFFIATAASASCATIFGGIASIFAMASSTRLRATQLLAPAYAVIVMNSGFFVPRSKLRPCLRWALDILPSSQAANAFLFEAVDDSSAIAVFTPNDAPRLSRLFGLLFLGEFLGTVIFGYLCAASALGVPLPCFRCCGTTCGGNFRNERPPPLVRIY